MSRFTPGIQRKGGLAQALQQGVQGYQEGQDRELRRDLTMANEGRTARASELSALEKGWRPDLGGALMQAPQFEPNAPGDFNRYTKSFTQIPINPTESVQMQSGGVWNPALPRDQKVQDTMALGGAKIDLGTLERNRLQSEFGGAVEQAGGNPLAGRDLPLIRDYLGVQPDDWAYVGANTGEPAMWVNRKTQQRRPADGSRPLPRATGSAGADGLTPSERAKRENAMEGSLLELAEVDEAIREVARNPGAFGVRNLIPQIARENVLDNSERVTKDSYSRAALSRIVTRLRHDMYGGALTPTEANFAAEIFSRSSSHPSAIAAQLQVVRNGVLRQAEMRKRLLGNTQATSTAGASAVPDDDLIGEFESRFGGKP